MSRHALALPCLLLCALAAATSIAGALQTGPASAQAQTSARLVAEGVALLRSDRADEAEQKFAEAAALAPSNPQAHYFLGVVLERRKQLDQAAGAYRRAIELSPSMAEAHDRLGFTLGLQGHVDQARESFARAVALNAGLFDAQYHLGVTDWLRRDPQRALAPLEAAVALQPRHPEAQYYLGLTLRALGKLPEAIGHFELATTLAPTLAVAHAHLGIAQREAGELDAAMRSLRRALELEPQRFDALNALGLTQMQRGDADQAVATFRQLLAAHPDEATARLNLGTALMQQGDLAGAVTVFRALTDGRPEHAEAFYNLGTALKQQDDFAGAETVLREAARLNPRLPDAHYTLGVVLWQTRRPAEAITAFRAAIEAKPDYAQAHYMLGTVLKQEGRLDQALAEFRLTLKYEPDSAEAHLSIGQVLRQQNDLNGAAQAFATADLLNRRKADAQAAAFASSGRRQPLKRPEEASTAIDRPKEPERRDSAGSAGFSFRALGAAAGLTGSTIFGGKATNRYLLETTGSGVALIDYDADGRLDLFLVNGTTLEGFPKGQEPRPHLYRNRGNGTFEDVTGPAGLHNQWGWGQGACVGDYDNDGHDDLFVTYYGSNRLFHNTGRGTFAEVTTASGLTTTRQRWGTGCAFLDIDRDGRLDLFVANYIDLDLATAPTPDSGLCRYKGVPVACGPPGLIGGKNLLYRNTGDGTFVDVSDSSGITKASGSYGLGVVTLDFDNDGWTDIYVANDSNPSALYRNRHDGTFEDIGVAAGCAYSQDGKPQAGMGVGIGDFDRNGWLDIVKTNFAGDTSSLYANTGQGRCEDQTFDAGLGLNTRWLGWGAGFADFDNDGWLDIFLTNGHVYPEVRQIRTEVGYEQRKVVYRNLGGRFDDVTMRLGAPATTPKAGRGTAFGDLDDNGTIDVVINNIHDTPDVFLTTATAGHHWLAVRLIGTRSNRNAIGARVRVITGQVTQIREVQGGGSYLSQNDLRVHVGLGSASVVDRVEVRWPNGLEETWTDVTADRLLTLREGEGKALSQ